MYRTSTSVRRARWAAFAALPLIVCGVDGAARARTSGEAVSRPAARSAAAKPAASGTAAARPGAGLKSHGGIVEERPQSFALPPKSVRYVEVTAEDKQEAANKIFKNGNRKFEKRQLDDAIRLYRKAYTIWPHPIILFNMAINLGFLSNPLAAAQKFRKVLEYLPGPISAERYAEAARHYRRLMGELAVLQVHCIEPEAKIFVDGKPFGRAPLEKTVTLAPGRHMVSASRQGKVPYSAELTLRPGRHYRINVSLKDFSDVVKYKTVSRYHWYIPTIATSVAAVALGIGAGLLASGRSTINDLRDEHKSVFDGSTPFVHDQAREDRAVSFQYAGQAMLGLAAAVATTAVVLWILRKKRVRYTVEASPTEGGAGVNFSF
ncbi:MAG: PEGA domain-containing protein [bacterium]